MPFLKKLLKTQLNEILYKTQKHTTFFLKAVYFWLSYPFIGFKAMNIKYAMMDTVSYIWHKIYRKTAGNIMSGGEEH